MAYHRRAVTAFAAFSDVIDVFGGDSVDTARSLNERSVISKNTKLRFKRTHG